MLYAILCYNQETVVDAWSKEKDDNVMQQHGAAMQKLAIDVPAGNPKPVGFKVGAGFGETVVRVAVKEHDCDEDDE